MYCTPKKCREERGHCQALLLLFSLISESWNGRCFLEDHEDRVEGLFFAFWDFLPPHDMATFLHSSRDNSPSPSKSACLIIAAHSALDTLTPVCFKAIYSSSSSIKPLLSVSTWKITNERDHVGEKGRSAKKWE